jgi:PKD repeat protein
MNRKRLFLCALLLVLIFKTGTGLAQFNADFSGEPRSGAAPLEVTFTDQSTGTVANWSWSFPGGSPPSATGQGPHSVTYNSHGTYSVTLNITGPVGTGWSDSETKSDYITVLEPLPDVDLGDAPDDENHHYATLLANNGAYHVIQDGISLGKTIDAETDGQPHPEALGDDMEGADEDGVVMSRVVIGDTARFKVTVVGDGYLNAWIDMNRDGDWDDPGEQVFYSHPLNYGIHTLAAKITETAQPGTTFTRFRFSTEEGLPYYGPAPDGEVEDYMVPVLTNREAFLQDSLILADLYNSTNGDYWTDNTNWLTGPVSTWYGVQVDLGRVTELEMYDNNLEGPIPPEIWTLTKLRSLSFGNDRFDDFRFPAEIGNLVDLESLDFSCSSRIFGEIPLEIGNLTKLTRLHLVDLVYVTGPIPVEIGNLTNLEDLSISATGVYGTIPPEIGNLTKLTELELDFNQLSGPVPDELSNLTALEILRISWNDFEGAIPAALAGFANIEIVDIHNNRFTDLPDLSACPNLFSLGVEENKLTFEDIEPNIGILYFDYAPQDSVGTEVDTTVNEGSRLELSGWVGGTANEYLWFKDGAELWKENSCELIFDPVEMSDEGTYLCRITNTIATDLTLWTRPVHVHVLSKSGIQDVADAIPERFALLQNYPNPFNPVTTIEYCLPLSAEVILTIYDLRGQIVKQIRKGKVQAGYHSVVWDTKDHQSVTVPSGIYFYRIEAGSGDEMFTAVRKMVLMR